MTHWLATAAKDGASGSTLDQYAQAIRRFTVFYLRYGETSETQEDVIRGFSHALDAGNTALQWTPLNGRVANRYFDAVCKFLDWLKSIPAYTHYEHPNPLVERPMTVAEQLSDASRSKHYNMLHHLRLLSKRGRGIRELRRYPYRNRWSGGEAPSSLDHPGSGWAPAGMSVEDYVELIRSEREPRNRLLWFILGAGAARISEALQIFASDIYYDQQTREAFVALANPVKGKVVLPGNATMERRQFLAEKFNLVPRCLLPRNHPLHAGWKGMLRGGFDDQERAQLTDWRSNMWSLVEWMMPMFGRLFWSDHLAYMRTRAQLRPNHPYYFVNLSRNCGEPLTRSAVKQLLETACIRAGLPRFSPHKLRHMYGNYLASTGIPLSNAQIMMRHTNALSTQVYYKVKRKEARHHLSIAERQSLLTIQERNSPFLFTIVPPSHQSP
jgi:site-specific recombinase XerD